MRSLQNLCYQIFDLNFSMGIKKEMHGDIYRVFKDVSSGKVIIITE